MYRLDGACHCGNLQVQMELSRPPVDISPRACDCDFCRKHGAAYVSDPSGSLLIRAANDRAPIRYRQGSESADFLICGICGVLLAVLYENGGRLYATVNATALRPVEFAAPQAANPKTLAAEDRMARWQKVWFSRVSMCKVDP